MRRPLGVTLLAAILLSISTLVFVLAAIAYKHPEILLQLHIVRLGRSETIVEAAGTFITFAPIGACVLAFLGVNLLLLRSWVRLIIVVVTGIGLFQTVAALILGFVLAPKKFVLNPLETIPIAVNASIVFYLTRPAVRAAFGERTDSRIYSE
jgi:hypothetical protein